MGESTIRRERWCFPLRDRENFTSGSFPIERDECHGTIGRAKVDTDAKFRARHSNGDSMANA